MEKLFLSNLPRGEAEASRGQQEDILTDLEACILRRSTHKPAVQRDSPNATASPPMQLPHELYSNTEDLAGGNVASQANLMTRFTKEVCRLAGDKAVESSQSPAPIFPASNCFPLPNKN